MAAIERYEGGPPELTERQLGLMERQAKLLARSPMCPEHFRGKPDEIMVVALDAHSLGMQLSLGVLHQFYVVHNRPEKMAQLQITLAARHGVRIWPQEGRCDEQSATVNLQRPGEDRVHQVTFTMADAERAGLPKQNAMYARYPDRMLLSRAVTKAIGSLAPWVKLAAAGSFLADFDTGEIDAGDRDGERRDDGSGEDDIVDADLVEHDDEGSALRGSGADAAEGATGSPEGAAAPDAALADDFDHTALKNRVAKLGDEFKRALSPRWKASGIHWPGDVRMTKVEVGEANDLLHRVEVEAAETYDRRRKHVNAKMNEVGVRTDDARHELMRTATAGRTETSAGLSAEDEAAIVGYCEQLAASEAGDDAPEARGMEPVDDESNPEGIHGGERF